MRSAYHIRALWCGKLVQIIASSLSFLRWSSKPGSIGKNANVVNNGDAAGLSFINLGASPMIASSVRVIGSIMEYFPLLFTACSACLSISCSYCNMPTPLPCSAAARAKLVNSIKPAEQRWMCQSSDLVAVFEYLLALAAPQTASGHNQHTSSVGRAFAEKSL